MRFLAFNTLHNSANYILLVLIGRTQELFHSNVIRQLTTVVAVLFVIQSIE
jgi:hypothetical protein